MMIDFAIAAQRDSAMNPREAITRACRLRFRPIIMTTLAAALGALPLIVSSGEGSELRRPLGLSIVGGLAVSQILTLYTTPVVYLYHGAAAAMDTQATHAAVSAFDQYSGGSQMTRSYLFLLTLTLTACAVGPNYRPPSDPTPTEFKELGAWKPATPRAEMPKGAWWSLLGDPTLDGLEKRVAVTNQKCQASRSGLSSGGGARAGNPRRPVSDSRYQQWCVPFDIQCHDLRCRAEWARFRECPVPLQACRAVPRGTLDVWGRIRRQVESQKAAAQVSAADLANSLLSAQSAVATDYVNLRAADSQVQLLTDTVACIQSDDDDYRESVCGRHGVSQ